MKTADVLPRMYEDLANHFARQGEPQRRDQCLVLAADAALRNGQPEEAERLRKRLLLTNPHHFLRPYTSMAEAMLASEVYDFVFELRKLWPPEMIAQLLNRPPGASKSEPPAPLPRRPASQPNAAAPPDEPVTLVGFFLALVSFSLGLIVAGGLLFAALGWPMLE
jgi:hypothetical protein